MKANELRIGNYIARKNYPNNHFSVEQILLQSNIYFIRYRDLKGWGGEAAVMHFRGIPISPEILEACGFSGIDQHNGTFDFFKLPKCPTGIASWVEYNSDGNLAYHYGGFINGIEVKYLHHLQNIFMDATGAELSINLEKVKA